MALVLVVGLWIVTFITRKGLLHNNKQIVLLDALA